MIKVICLITTTKVIVMMMKAIVMVAMIITAVIIMTNDIAKDYGVDDDNDYDNYNYGSNLSSPV